MRHRLIALIFGLARHAKRRAIVPSAWLWDCRACGWRRPWPRLAVHASREGHRERHVERDELCLPVALVREGYQWHVHRRRLVCGQGYLLRWRVHVPKPPRDMPGQAANTRGRHPNKQQRQIRYTAAAGHRPQLSVVGALRAVDPAGQEEGLPQLAGILYVIESGLGVDGVPECLNRRSVWADVAVVHPTLSKCLGLRARRIAVAREDI